MLSENDDRWSLTAIIHVLLLGGRFVLKSPRNGGGGRWRRFNKEQRLRDLEL